MGPREARSRYDARMPRCPRCGSEHEGDCPPKVTAAETSVQRPRRANAGADSGASPSAPSAPPAPAPPGPPPVPDALDNLVDRLRAGPEGVALKAGSRVGEYEIVGPLGKGGMGIVYSARHPVIGKRVAVKVLRGDYAADPEAVERFVSEARAVNEIGHPNIVDIFAFGELPDGRPFFVMELLEGESLRQRLHRDKQVPLVEALSILVPVCGALAAAHKAGIVHRDLKPDNVMIVRGREGGRVIKLLDFGVAKLSSGKGPTRVGLVLGTPRYMAPEQIRGLPVEARGDLYALGVLLYETICGHPPFSGKTIDEITASRAAGLMAMHIHVPAVPAALERLVERLLDAEPTRRPESATIVQIELAGMLSQAGGGHEPVTEPTRPAKPRSSGLLLGLLAIGVLGGAGYVAAPYVLGRPRAPAPVVRPPDAAPVKVTPLGAAGAEAPPPAKKKPAAREKEKEKERPAEKKATLVVHADQPRVSFTLDGVPVGDGTGQLRLADLEPGRTYRVRAEARFHKPREERIKLRTAEVRELRWTLQRAPRGTR